MYKIKKTFQTNLNLKQTSDLIRDLKYGDNNQKCCEDLQNSNFMLLLGENYKHFIGKLLLNIKLKTQKKIMKKKISKILNI